MEGSRKLKICYLADRHSLYDDRIYWKMALAMRQRGHSVHYLLMGDKEEQGYTEEGIGYQILKNQDLPFQPAAQLFDQAPESEQQLSAHAQACRRAEG